MNPTGEQEPQILPTSEKQVVDLNEKFPLQSLRLEKGAVKFRDIQPEIPMTEAAESVWKVPSQDDYQKDKEGV